MSDKTPEGKPSSTNPRPGPIPSPFVTPPKDFHKNVWGRKRPIKDPWRTTMAPPMYPPSPTKTLTTPPATPGSRKLTSLYKGRWDVLTLEKGLTRMNEAGLINYSNMPPIKQNFTASNTTIHPVFRRANWRGIDQQEYGLLEPAIQLASGFLCEPSVISFFNGLSNNNLKPLNNPTAEAQFGQTLMTFDYNIHNLPGAFKEVLKMRDKVTWTFAPLDAWAETNLDHCISVRNLVTGVVVPKTMTSKIALAVDFLDVLQGKVDPSSFPRLKEECSPYDVQAARIRTIFLLAVAMIHELCHAFESGDREYEPDLMTHVQAVKATGNHLVEPFWKDHRAAEVGQALEQCLFGGTNDVLGQGESASCPHGLSTTTFPGIFHEGVEKADKEDVQDRVYGTKMAEIHRFFTQEFWDNLANRYDLDAFKFDRTHNMWAQLVYGDDSIFQNV